MSEKEKSIALGISPSAIYTKNETASFLKSTKRYVERMVSAGRLKQLKPSPKMVRFRGCDIEDFLNS